MFVVSVLGDENRTRILQTCTDGLHCCYGRRFLRRISKKVIMSYTITGHSCSVTAVSDSQPKELCCRVEHFQLLLLLMVSSSLYVSHMLVTRILSSFFSELSFSRINESTTGYTFTPCVGSLTSPGIDTR